MTALARFNPKTHVVGLSRKSAAQLLVDTPGPPQAVDGFTFGIASMHESAPHQGEMHPDGDEVLYVISGRIMVLLETDPVERVELGEGDGLIVPQGVWHKVDILEPAQIAFLTPGPNNQYRQPSQ